MIVLSMHRSNQPASQTPIVHRSDSLLLGLAILWPAAAAILAFFNLERRVPRLVLTSVMVLLGYRMVIADERFDAFRLASFVEEIARLRWWEFAQWVDQYCFSTEKCIDPIQPFFTFLLTRFSDSISFSFAGYALVFSLFSIATLAAVRHDFSRQAKLFSWFFLIAMMATNPIHNIGGFRFNTASWIFLLGVYLVFVRQRDYGFVFLLLSVAFHYSMSVLLVLIFVLRFVSPSIRMALFVALLSFTFSPLGSSSAGWLTGSEIFDLQLGAVSRAARYLSEGALEAQAEALQRATSSNLFYFYYARSGIKIALGLWMMHLLFIKKRLIFPKNVERFLIAALLLFAISNVFSWIPSVSRYEVISIQMIYAGFCVSALAYSSTERATFFALLVPGILFSMLFPLRIGLGLIDVYSLGPSPFLLLERDALY